MSLAFFPHSYQCVKGTRITGMKNIMLAVSSILSPKELLSCIMRLYLSCIMNKVPAVTRPTTVAECSIMGEKIFISVSPQKQTHGNLIAQHLPYTFVWIKWTQEWYPYLYNQFQSNLLLVACRVMETNFDVYRKHFSICFLNPSKIISRHHTQRSCLFIEFWRFHWW